jgi:hypothetical protein
MKQVLDSSQNQKRTHQEKKKRTIGQSVEYNRRPGYESIQLLPPNF